MPFSIATPVITLSHFINGTTECGCDPARYGEVYNPATGEVTKHVPFATKEVVDEAVEAAARAFPMWSAQPPLRRARVMFRFSSCWNGIATG